MSIDNTDIYPSFMILSLKGDKLHISFAKAFGGFKKYYASISVNKLSYQESFILDKIHSRHGYSWIHQVHEVLTSEIEEVAVEIPIVLNHYQDRLKSREMYLEILESLLIQDMFPTLNLKEKH